MVSHANTRAIYIYTTSKLTVKKAQKQTCVSLRKNLAKKSTQGMIASWTPLRRQARVIHVFALAAFPPTGHRGTIALMSIDISTVIGIKHSTSLPEACLFTLWGSSAVSPYLSRAWDGILQGDGRCLPLLLRLLLLLLPPGRMRETGRRMRGRRERRKCGVSVCVCGGEWVWRRWCHWQQ